MTRLLSAIGVALVAAAVAVTLWLQHAHAVHWTYLPSGDAYVGNVDGARLEAALAHCRELLAGAAARQLNGAPVGADIVMLATRPVAVVVRPDLSWRDSLQCYRSTCGSMLDSCKTSPQRDASSSCRAVRTATSR